MLIYYNIKDKKELSMSVKIYEVGGSVRDRLLGKIPKDIDYAVEADSFEEMLKYCEEKCEKVFLIKPEFGTIRALKNKQAVDFTLCRNEGFYSDGRHPDKIERTSIQFDLKRRDFTVNAMAIDEDGNLLDPFNGRDDLNIRRLCCVGNTEDRFNEDSLRILRALRFRITKGFSWSSEIWDVFENPKFWIPKLESVSKERIREELTKCFQFDTSKTIFILRNLKVQWTESLLKDMWLKPTTEKI